MLKSLQLNATTIQEVRRLRQENIKFKASLGYIVRPCLKKQCIK
jgi:hypothetical protein